MTPAVLIVEDDADVRRTLEYLLQQAGIETVSASDGLEGMKFFRAHRPRCQITPNGLHRLWKPSFFVEGWDNNGKFGRR